MVTLKKRNEGRACGRYLNDENMNKNLNKRYNTQTRVQRQNYNTWDVKTRAQNGAQVTE